MKKNRRIVLDVEIGDGVTIDAVKKKIREIVNFNGNIYCQGGKIRVKKVSTISQDVEEIIKMVDIAIEEKRKHFPNT